MSVGSWKCLVCGHDDGDFKLLGNGLVRCPNCATVHYVQANGELVLCATDEKLFKKGMEAQDEK